MKKVFLFAAAAMMSAAMYADLQVADFENINLAAEQELKFANDTTVFFESGSFSLQETVSYSGSSVAGAVISSHSDTVFGGLQDANKSIAGGAYEGQNYAVWYEDGWIPNSIKLNEAAVVPGMFVCNNNYAYNSMKYGDAMAGEPFGETDYFTLIVYAKLNGVGVNARVFVDLAEGTNIMDKWTYVDLSSLGEIDELTFAFSGSRANDYGVLTPTYFCIDNIGATAPVEAITNTKAEIKATKMIRNGQVIIVRDGKMYNVMGVEL
ncbi:MAG: DUF4465 domain-containing protein [Paludibacteraceae bacterium]|nr:DUF4465 domain-containing protein [Paludibacteraceae bacterium]